MVVFSCIFWSDSMIAVILTRVHLIAPISGSRGLLVVLSCMTLPRRACSIRNTPHVVSIIVRDSFADCGLLRLIWERVLSSIPHTSGEVISLPSPILPLSSSLVSRDIIGTICATIFRLVSLRSRAGSMIVGVISREMESPLRVLASLRGCLSISISYWYLSLVGSENVRRSPVRVMSVSGDHLVRELTAEVIATRSDRG